MTIAEEALTTGRDIVASPEANVASTINGGLATFVGWPYELRQEAWFDLDGRASHAFASVVCMGEGSGQQPASAIISDRVAAVIDTSESLDLDSFRSAYARIAAAKRHKKSPSPRVDGTCGNADAAFLAVRFEEREEVFAIGVAGEDRLAVVAALGEMEPVSGRGESISAGQSGFGASVY